MIAAVIVAAGQGLRMGSSVPKQFLLLGGKPIVVRTLDRFLSCPSIDPIILVMAREEINTGNSLLNSTPGDTKRVQIVAGGDSRRKSVSNGLQAIGSQKGIVLIHDGVRPLISGELIETCVQGARDWGACIPALNVNETLKQVNGNYIVERTVTRQGLWLAQTPQAFDLALIRKAHQQAEAEQWQVTDDAALVERMGRKVKIIPGAADNIKITTPEDLRLAEVLLKNQSQPS